MQKRLHNKFRLSIIIIILFSITMISCTNIKDNSDKFCGSSTFGPCNNDNDCKTSGCSGQICKSMLEEEIISDCEYKECYQTNLKCGCIQNQCQWS